MTISFQYAPEIFVHFPHTVGGILVGRHVQNGPTAAALAQRFAQEQQATLQRIGARSFANLASTPPRRAARPKRCYAG